MKTLSITIQIDKKFSEILVSELGEMGFHGFEEKNGILVSYIGAHKFKPFHREKIETLLKKYPGDNYIISEKKITAKNWNKSWEAGIGPLEIGDFVVTPTWSQETVSEHKIHLLIDPKMSFGTGYHATTRLMLKALPVVISYGDRVLDVGTGTGILSIASVKLGAKEATGIDIDEWSYQNALENIELNKVSRQVSIKHGSIEKVPEEDLYQVILANINRNIINKLAGDILKRLSSEGKLLLSGLLKDDLKNLNQQHWFTNLTLMEQWEEGEWIALLLGK